jgi:alkanesulfonate monooxygenase SsuD/methylene tetrahydromethanopterin reductase-like flavin-dependent oxidoreductase (luciferase family)
MRYGISIPNMGPVAELVALGAAADAAGFDGVFLWDHLHFIRAWRVDVHDPWVVLGALAVRTERALLGTLVTPVARRQPWELAKQVTTLSHLSGGRVMLGVGLGEPADDEFEAFGLPGPARVRAARLDEGLALLDALWTGEPVDFDGDHFRVDAELHPTPVAPVPVWVAGQWPGTRPFQRAAARQGVVPIAADGNPLPPGAYADVLAACGGARPGFDLVATVMEDVPPAAYEEAGATWALWSTWPTEGWQDRIRAVVEAGPPG